MIKGTVMLLATLVSSAFSVNASEEVSILIPSKSMAASLNASESSIRLEEKITQLDKDAASSASSLFRSYEY